jgi:hypothetical protein
LAKAEEGICHLCGKDGPLSFEHVPPESAFNDRPVLLGAIDDVWDTEFDDSKLRGKIQQRGASCRADVGPHRNGWTDVLRLLSEILLLSFPV